MKKSEMRKAYDKALKKIVEADLALQEFGKFIVFKGFGEFEPTIGFVNECCVAISYSDMDRIYEIDGADAIEIMAKNGCITPDDF